MTTDTPTKPVLARAAASAADRLAQLERDLLDANARADEARRLFEGRQLVIDQQAAAIMELNELAAEVAICTDTPIDATPAQLKDSIAAWSRDRARYEQVVNTAQGRLLDLENELARTKNALGAPRAVGVTYVIDSRTGDAVVAALSDGSVYRMQGDNLRRGEHEWTPLPPVPTTRAAILATPAKSEAA